MIIHTIYASSMSNRSRLHTYVKVLNSILQQNLIPWNKRTPGLGTFGGNDLSKDWPIKKMTKVYPRFIIENK